MSSGLNLTREYSIEVMLDGKISANDQLLLAEVKSLIEKRKDSYGKVRVSSVIKKETNGWRNVFTTFEIQPRDADGQAEHRYDYEYFKIRVSSMELADFVATLNKLVNEAKLEIPDWESLNVEGTLQKDISLYSHYRGSNDPLFGTKWPTNIFTFQVKNEHRGSLPGETLVSLSQPLFDDGYSALEATIGFNRNYSSQYLGQIIFLIPNFTARLAQVKIGSKQLTLRAEVKAGKHQELLAKVSCGLYPQSYRTDAQFDKEEVTVPLSFAPNFYTIYLLSKNTGEVLDYKRFGLSWPNLTDDIVIEAGPEDIEEIIKRGENEEVEFKQEFPKNWEEFAETLIAFANGKGGSILLGVADDGVITGIKDQKIDETIQNCIRTYAEPPLQIKTTKHQVRNEMVVWVQVKEGDNKPYTVRGKGVFIRAGSTDRNATRDEIDGFYTQRFPRAPWQQ